jgi:hypothetical protein
MCRRPRVTVTAAQRTNISAESWNMPPIANVDDLGRVYDSVLEAMSQGELTPAEGLQIASILDRRAKLLGFGGDPDLLAREPTPLTKSLLNE